MKIEEQKQNYKLKTTISNKCDVSAGPSYQKAWMFKKRSVVELQSSVVSPHLHFPRKMRS